MPRALRLVVGVYVLGLILLVFIIIKDPRYFLQFSIIMIQDTSGWNRTTKKGPVMTTISVKNQR